MYFIKRQYKDIFVASLQYCQKNKGLELYAWCITSSYSQGRINSVNCIAILGLDIDTAQIQHGYSTDTVQIVHLYFTPNSQLGRS
jgi:hypothetical protein